MLYVVVYMLYVVLFTTADHREIAKKWENLRRSYRRHCNVKKNAKKSGSAANDDTDCDDNDEDDGIWDKMLFLEPYMKVQQTVSNMVCLMTFEQHFTNVFMLCLSTLPFDYRYVNCFQRN